MECYNVRVLVVPGERDTSAKTAMVYVIQALLIPRSRLNVEKNFHNRFDNALELHVYTCYYLAIALLIIRALKHTCTCVMEVKYICIAMHCITTTYLLLKVSYSISICIG